MKVCFVAPLYGPEKHTDYIPLGILCLISQLRKDNDCYIVDMNCFLEVKRKNELQKIYSLTINEIMKHKPDLVGFYCLCSSFHLNVIIAKRIKKLLPDGKIIFGGPNTLKIEKEILAAFSFVDAVISGEADETIVKFVNILKKKGQISEMPGIYIRTTNESNPLNVSANMEKLPLPAYDILPIKKYDQLDHRNVTKGISIDAGRGCIFNCSFCSTRESWTVTRQKSAARILREMNYLYKIFKKNRFYLLHDNFAFNKNAFREFLNYFIKNNNHYRWNCSVTQSMLDESLIDMCVDAGCASMFWGLESASPHVQKMIGKIQDRKKIENNVKYTCKKGIKVTTSFIIGFPFETKKEMQRTLDFHREIVDLGIYKSMVNILCPMPASRLIRQGYEIYYDGFSPILLNSPALLDDESIELVKSHPKIFSSLYKYKNKEIDDFEIKVACYIANQYGA